MTIAAAAEVVAVAVAQVVVEAVVSVAEAMGVVAGVVVPEAEEWDRVPVAAVAIAAEELGAVEGPEEEAPAVVE